MVTRVSCIVRAVDSLPTSLPVLIFMHAPVPPCLSISTLLHGGPDACMHEARSVSQVCGHPTYPGCMKQATHDTCATFTLNHLARGD